MHYLYCQSCFKKTAQTSDIVKFCAHCGKPFDESFAVSKQFIEPVWADNRKEIIGKSSTDHLPTTTDFYRCLLAKRGIKEVEDDDLEEGNDDDNARGEDVSVPHIDKFQVDVDIQRDKGISVKSLARNVPRKPRTQTTSKPKKRDKNFLQEYMKSAAALRPK